MEQISRALRAFIFVSLAGAITMNCAVAPDLPSTAPSNIWYRQGQADLEAALQRPANKTRARNIILFIGDGMDISTITAARILEGQRRGQPGEENFLSFEYFPHTGLAKTYNTNQQTPDSAGTATAMLSGIKTKAGVIGLPETVQRGNCQSAEGLEVESILDLAEAAGRSTGVVTTARITHATPAAAYAHSADRGWEGDGVPPPGAAGCSDIALQLVDYSQGDGIEVLFGGGRENFLPDNQPDPEYPDASGERTDQQNLIARWQFNNGDGRFVWNRAGFAALSSDPPAKVLGLFEASHMNYEINRPEDRAGEPSLAEMTETAVKMLARDPDGYFLLIEGGRIDHGHHDGSAYRALSETIALSDAVRTAVEMTRSSETLIIVTADHGHTMRIAGYPTRGNPILGKVIENDSQGEALSEPEHDLLGQPYTTLGYINGPGFQGPSDQQAAGPKRFLHKPASARPLPEARADLSDVDTTHPDYLQEAGIPTFGTNSAGQPEGSETHSAGDVPIYATGPGAHLLTGVHEQNYLFHVMRYVAGL